MSKVQIGELFKLRTGSSKFNDFTVLFCDCFKNLKNHYHLFKFQYRQGDTKRSHAEKKNKDYKNRANYKKYKNRL